MSLLVDLLVERFGTHRELEAERFVHTSPPPTAVVTAAPWPMRSTRGAWQRLGKLKRGIEAPADSSPARRAS